MRESFLVQRYVYDIIREQSDADRLKLYDSLFQYAFDAVPIPNESPACLLNIIREQIDGNIKSYDSYKTRVSSGYRSWRNAVFKRDGKRCRVCGSEKGLVVHHIIPFSRDKDSRFSVNNGIILCEECHRKVHEVL